MRTMEAGYYNMGGLCLLYYKNTVSPFILLSQDWSDAIPSVHTCESNGDSGLLRLGREGLAVQIHVQFCVWFQPLFVSSAGLSRDLVRVQ
jgi:hypothetical protein